VERLLVNGHFVTAVTRREETIKRYLWHADCRWMELAHDTVWWQVKVVAILNILLLTQC